MKRIYCYLLVVVFLFSSNIVYAEAAEVVEEEATKAVEEEGINKLKKSHKRNKSQKRRASKKSSKFHYHKKETLETEDVYISAEKLQCDEASGYSVLEGEAWLNDIDIDVIEYFCGEMTGVLFASVCGGGTADIYIYRIGSDDLLNAENAGFSNVTSLDSYAVADSCDTDTDTDVGSGEKL